MAHRLIEPEDVPDKKDSACIVYSARSGIKSFCHMVPFFKSMAAQSKRLIDSTRSADVTDRKHP